LLGTIAVPGAHDLRLEGASAVEFRAFSLDQLHDLEAADVERVGSGDSSALGFVLRINDLDKAVFWIKHRRGGTAGSGLRHDTIRAGWEDSERLRCTSFEFETFIEKFLALVGALSVEPERTSAIEFGARTFDDLFDRERAGVVA